MSKIKRIVILIACFQACLISKAQDPDNTIGRVSIASPNAASLGKYGDIPVSYHTGLPNVSIPIYTVESGSLKLPIGLSYHASGLKVQEQASWVGAGWSLNAGGMITRTVVGAPDDRGFASQNFISKGHYSDFGFNSYTGPNMINTDNNFYHGYYDGEPDLYFFNFGSYSGKFYFNDDRTPILVPEQDFKIQTDFTLGPGFTGFIITTPDGIRYYFGKSGNNGPIDPIESTIPATTQAGGSFQTAAASSWFLNKVMSSDGTDSITLQYQQEKYSYYALSMSQMVSSAYLPTDASKMGVNLVKNFVTGVRLSQINFPNGTINFTPAPSFRTDLSDYNISGVMIDAANTSASALGSISIKNNMGFCKKDSFYYGYFFDNSALTSPFAGAYTSDNLQSDKYRLRLDSMQELSCDASVKLPPYKFSYSGVPPRKLSFGVDHWGYYNGASNSTLVPTYTVTSGGNPTTYPGANRDASWPEMLVGSLQKITYPTGGNTAFDFEPKNIYTFNSSTLQYVGYGGGVIHEYGQADTPLIRIVPFTIVTSGGTVPAFQMVVRNTSTNYEPKLTIKDAAGNPVASTPIFVASPTAGNTTFFTNTVTLATGNYTATLEFPANTTGLINGADFSIGQYQYLPTSTSLTVGGLRIKTITNDDGLTPNKVITSYNYNAGGSTSTGVLYSRPVYCQTIRNSTMALVYPYPAQNGCWGSYGLGYFVTPGSLEPMATTQGENVGYDEVDVSQTGNGHSVYRYYGSNVWQSTLNDVCTRSVVQTGQCDFTIPDYPAAPLAFEFMRGELKYEGHFSENGQLLKETNYNPVYTPDPLTTPGHVMGTISGPSSDYYVGSTSVYFTEYNLQSAAKTRNTITELVYDPTTSNAVSTTSTVYYNSPFHHQATRKVTTTSTGDSLVTNMKYAADFRLTSCDASIPDSLAYFMTAITGDYTSMRTSIETCSPQVGDVTNCRIAVYSTYRQNVARDRGRLITYRRRSYAPDTSNILSRCYATAFPAADTLLKPILRLQNEYYNPPIESSQWKDLNLLHASYTRFDTTTSPVGLVYPARTKLINLQATSTTFTNASVSGSTVAKDSRYADESSYTFNIGNPVQVTAHDGIANSYIWDYQNSEPIAKVSNATISQVAYSSFEADGKGGWTFAGVPITDATSPTGGKCYNLSSGTLSKIGLITTSTYIISYWSKTGASFTVTGSSSVKQGKTINGWTYFEHTATGASTINVSGAGNIDELRLYPSTAQMITYTYTPLVGMTSACDADNKITYYFYDNFGRLKWIKDQDLNIIKTIQYHYATISGTQY